MSTVRTFQRSLSGGIVSPELHSRMDLQKFQNGAEDILNMIPLAHGPAKRRPGFGLTNRAKHPDRKHRLMPFIYSGDQALVLEVGHEYMRMHVNGATVLEDSGTIDGVTAGFQTKLSFSGDSPANLIEGRWVYLSGITGTVGGSLNGVFFEVFDVDLGAKTFRIRDVVTGEDISTTGYSYTSGGSFAMVYEIEAPWSEDDLYLLRHSQEGDIVTVTYEDYPAYEILRYGATNWVIQEVDTLADSVFDENPILNANEGSGVAPTGGQTFYASGTRDTLTEEQGYVATAVIGGAESLPSPPMYGMGVSIMSAYSADPNARSQLHLYTQVNPQGSLWEYGFFCWTPDIPELHKKIVQINTVNYSLWYDITLRDVSTLLPILIDPLPFLGGWGFSFSEPHYLLGIQAKTKLSESGQANTIRFKSPPGNIEYFNIYKLVGAGQYGYIGRAYDPYFVDRNVAADLTTAPPRNNSWFDNGNNPMACGNFEQRRVFGGAKLSQQTTYMSASGARDSFVTSTPLKPTDAIAVRTAVGDQNAVRHVATLNDLIVFTSGGVVRMFSTNGDPLSNENIMPRIVSYGGSSHTAPVVAKNAVLFEAAVGGHLMEVAYSGGDQGYQVNDVSVIAPDLFQGKTLTQLAFARSPVPTMWAVRSDGALLSFTYLPEHKVTAWARHDTGNGIFESVCVIPEGNEDVVYVSVKRTINGNTVRTIERMSDMFDPQTRAEGEYLDCHLKYSGEATDTISGLWVFEGQDVFVFADGASLGTMTVTNGKLELDYEVSTCLIGFNTENVGIDTLPLYIETEAMGVGIEKNIVDAHIRISKSAKFQIGPDVDNLTDFEMRTDEDWDTALGLFTGEFDAPPVSDWGPDGTMSIRIKEPLPLTILSFAMEVGAGE